jgi:hypothetical protein
MSIKQRHQYVCLKKHDISKTWDYVPWQNESEDYTSVGLSYSISETG